MSEENAVEFRPALTKLWMMLIVFALFIPGGAVAAVAWWFQIPVAPGFVLNTKAGIVGLVAIPVGLLLAIVMGALLATARTLIIRADRVQFLARGEVTIEIPFENVESIDAQGEGNAGVVGFQLRDRNDPATRVPSDVKDRFEVQVLTYGKSLNQIHEAVNQRYQKYLADVR